MQNEHIYKRQELANALTHGAGAVLSLIGLVVLVLTALERNNERMLVSFLIYGLGITFLFTASTLYHSFHKPKLKKLFQVLDHVGIYLMIAGTYTPFAMVTIEKSWGELLLMLVWAIAGLGIVFKVFFTGKFRLLSTVVYLVMGWLAVVAVEPMIAAIPLPGIVLIVAGGLAFSVGTIFYLWERYVYHHAIWHVFVLVGGACHYFAILFYSY